jgi:quercetin dioxygenase-like cupin family protein
LNFSQSRLDTTQHGFLFNISDYDNGGVVVHIIRFSKAESYEPEKDWKRVSLCNRSDISIEHFIKPAGHASPMHDHPSAQVLIVLKGRLSVITDSGEQYLLDEGDAAYIPGGEPHVVTNPLNEASIGLDIFVPGRSFDFWLKRNRGGNHET